EGRIERRCELDDNRSENRRAAHSRVAVSLLERKFYATSSKVEGKHWCQNMIRSPAVEITLSGKKLSCRANQVTDEVLRKRILTLRDTPPQLNRVVFEIVPNQ